MRSSLTFFRIGSLFSLYLVIFFSFYIILGRFYPFFIILGHFLSFFSLYWVVLPFFLIVLGRFALFSLYWGLRSFLFTSHWWFPQITIWNGLFTEHSDINRHNLLNKFLLLIGWIFFFKCILLFENFCQFFEFFEFTEFLVIWFALQDKLKLKIILKFLVCHHYVTSISPLHSRGSTSYD